MFTVLSIIGSEAQKAFQNHNAKSYIKGTKAKENQSRGTKRSSFSCVPFNCKYFFQWCIRGNMHLQFYCAALLKVRILYKRQIFIMLLVKKKLWLLILKSTKLHNQSYKFTWLLLIAFNLLIICDTVILLWGWHTFSEYGPININLNYNTFTV